MNFKGKWILRNGFKAEVRGFNTNKEWYGFIIGNKDYVYYTWNILGNAKNFEFDLITKEPEGNDPLTRRGA